VLVTHGDWPRVTSDSPEHPTASSAGVPDVAPAPEAEADGLGWLGDDEYEITARPDHERRRTVGISDLHKITGLHEISAFKKILERDGQGSAPSELHERLSRVPRREVGDAAALGMNAPDGPQRSDESGRHRAFPMPGAADSEGGHAGRPETGRLRRLGSGEVERSSPSVVYLHCDVYDRPFCLRTQFTYIIGRDAASSVCLPDAAVSKRHAVVVFDKDAFYIEDARSLNGTYVNGRCITRIALRQGDFVDIGPFHFQVLIAEEGAAAPELTTDPMADTRQLPSLPGAISSRLGPTDVAELLLFIHRTGRTGVATVRCDRWAGRMFVDQGEVLHARAGRVIGDEALRIILGIDTGELHFADEPVRVRRTVTGGTFDFIEAALEDVIEP
jgi:hypothetical protein